MLVLIKYHRGFRTVSGRIFDLVRVGAYLGVAASWSSGGLRGRSYATRLVDPSTVLLSTVTV